MKQPDASTLDLLPKSEVAWNSCEECHHCPHLSRHRDAVQAQSSHGSLTWLLLGVASKLLLTAGLSMQRMAAYAATLPHCKVTATHTTSHATRHATSRATSHWSSCSCLRTLVLMLLTTTASSACTARVVCSSISATLSRGAANLLTGAADTVVTSDAVQPSCLVAVVLKT